MQTAAPKVAALVALTLVLAAAGSVTRFSPASPVEVDGDASSGIATAPPNRAVQAAFAARSYASGATAVLRLRGSANGLRVRIYHAGAGHDGPLQGAPVGPTQTLRGSAETATVTLGTWPSGLYYASVGTPGRGVWYAPFVLRARHPGSSRVLVVLPTNTWQAYNFEDGGSWYLSPEVHTVDLSRPFVDGGVPPHYHGYDRGFLRWLALHHEGPDFASDDDLDSITSSAGDLARAYNLIVFPGHEEYVTTHEYDLIQRYRDLGGNLAFLSANDFFYKVVKHGHQMDGRWRWRDLGRPEAALVGAQYVDWNHGRYANRPFTVTGSVQAPWLFRGTGLHNGASFGVYGIEIDALAPSSPPETRVLARIHDIFGPGKSAEMTYYTTSGAAKVFSAGVMNFGGSALWPVVSTMMENIWAELTRA
jgi:hypothetical protein